MGSAFSGGRGDYGATGFMGLIRSMRLGSSVSRRMYPAEAHALDRQTLYALPLFTSISGTPREELVPLWSFGVLVTNSESAQNVTSNSPGSGFVR